SFDKGELIATKLNNIDKDNNLKK
ncbi:MAG: hypothetical protein K0R94_984, partial [Burkholderiales bacterium]|nr:hypothetical protein [Burkholderiales bacterium]